MRHILGFRIMLVRIQSGMRNHPEHGTFNVKKYSLWQEIGVMEDWLLQSKESSKYFLKNVRIANMGAATTPTAEMEHQEASLHPVRMLKVEAPRLRSGLGWRGHSYAYWMAAKLLWVPTSEMCWGKLFVWGVSWKTCSYKTAQGSGCCTKLLIIDAAGHCIWTVEKLGLIQELGAREAVCYLAG